MKLKRLTAIMLLGAALVIPAAARQHRSVSILGDSYSTFEGFVEPSTNEMWYTAKPYTDRTDVDDVTQTWWHIFLTENDCLLERNNSYSGSTVSTTGYRGNDYSDRSFLTRMNNLGSPDMILVFGGTNDSWAGSPLGEWDWDGDSQGDFKSFRPALARMLSWLQKRHPNAEIVFMLNDGLKDSVNESVREACNRYGVKLVELHDISKKSGHPDRAGMRQIADQLTEQLGLNKQ